MGEKDVKGARKVAMAKGRSLLTLSHNQNNLPTAVQTRV